MIGWSLLRHQVFLLLPVSVPLLTIYMHPSGTTHEIHTTYYETETGARGSRGADRQRAPQPPPPPPAARPGEIHPMHYETETGARSLKGADRQRAPPPPSAVRPGEIHPMHYETETGARGLRSADRQQAPPPPPAVRPGEIHPMHYETETGARGLRSADRQQAPPPPPAVRPGEIHPMHYEMETGDRGSRPPAAHRGAGRQRAPPPVPAARPGRHRRQRASPPRDLSAAPRQPRETEDPDKVTTTVEHKTTYTTSRSTSMAGLSPPPTAGIEYDDDDDNDDDSEYEYDDDDAPDEGSLQPSQTGDERAPRHPTKPHSYYVDSTFYDSPPPPHSQPPPSAPATAHRTAVKVSTRHDALRPGHRHVHSRTRTRQATFSDDGSSDGRAEMDGRALDIADRLPAEKQRRESRDSTWSTAGRKGLARRRRLPAEARASTSGTLSTGARKGPVTVEAHRSSKRTLRPGVHRSTMRTTLHSSSRRAKFPAEARGSHRRASLPADAYRSARKETLPDDAYEPARRATVPAEAHRRARKGALPPEAYEPLYVLEEPIVERRPERRPTRQHTKRSAPYPDRASKRVRAPASKHVGSRLRHAVPAGRGQAKRVRHETRPARRGGQLSGRVQRAMPAAARRRDSETADSMSTGSGGRDSITRGGVISRNKAGHVGVLLRPVTRVCRCDQLHRNNSNSNVGVTCPLHGPESARAARRPPQPRQPPPPPRPPPPAGVANELQREVVPVVISDIRQALERHRTSQQPPPTAANRARRNARNRSATGLQPVCDRPGRYFVRDYVDRK